MVVDRYKGYYVYSQRETFYRVLDGKESFNVFDERTGLRAFTFTGFYNPKAMLLPADKEQVITAIMEPVSAAIRDKIDRGDLTDGFLHVGRSRQPAGTDASPAPAPGDAGQ